MNECKSCGTITDKHMCPVCQTSKYLIKKEEKNGRTDKDL